jgi:hypothetical protein
MHTMFVHWTEKGPPFAGKVSAEMAFYLLLSIYFPCKHTCLKTMPTKFQTTVLQCHHGTCVCASSA